MLSNMLSNERTSRRALLRRSAMIGGGLAGAALIGCSGAPKKSVTDNAPQAAATSAAPASQPAAGRAGVPVVQGAPKRGGSWTESIPETSPQQDMNTATNQSIWQQISERALALDPWEATVQPNIVEKWESPDTTTFILSVRKGVKVHNKPPWNGREFDAEDLAYNMNRMVGNTAAAEGLAKTAFPRADSLPGMTSAEVVDKYTVRVKLSKPSFAFLTGLAEYRNVLMPKGIVEVGFKDPNKFAGIGAFQVENWQEGVREQFTRNEAYYKKDQPYFDKLVRQVVPDRAARLAGFISKQFTTFPSPNLQDEKTAKAARPDALTYSVPGSNWHNLRFNMKTGPFLDIRIRKAMQLSLDYGEIGDGYYGPGWAYMSAFHPNYKEAWNEDKVKTLPGYNPATKAKDREEASKLMAAAGRANGDGIAFDLMLPSGSPSSDAFRENCLRFQGQMQKVFAGMKVTLKPSQDFASFAKLQNEGTFQLVAYSIVAIPDIAQEAYSQYHSKGSRNYGRFENAEADALIEKLQSELKPEGRKDLIDQFQQKYVSEWQSMIQLYIPPSKSMLQPNIGGYDKVVGPWGNGTANERLGSYYSVS